MSKVDDIKKAVSALGDEELVKFRAWLDALDAKRAAAGKKPAPPGDKPAPPGDKPEGLAQQAFKQFKAGRVRNL